jgi:hypothetical protein
MPETVPKIKIFSTMVGVTLDQLTPPLARPNVPADTSGWMPSWSAITTYRSQTTVRSATREAAMAAFAKSWRRA